MMTHNIGNSSSRGFHGFYGLHGYQACTRYTDLHVGKTLIHIKGKVEKLDPSVKENDNFF